MLDIFTNNSDTVYPTMRVPQFGYVRNGLEHNLASVRHVVRESASTVHNSHVLIKILLSLTVPKSHPPQMYVDMVADSTAALHNGMGIVSAVTPGAIHERGHFFSSYMPEIWLSANEDFDADVAYANYMTLRPVTVLRHPWDTLTLHVPDGIRVPDPMWGADHSRVSVIAINIPMLALQYKAWLENSDRTLSVRPSVEHFVYGWALEGMLASYLDVAIFNRLVNTYTGVPVGRYHTWQACASPDYTPQLDFVITKWVTAFNSTRDTFDQMLTQVEGLTKPTMREALVLPDVPVTRNNEWALLVSRLRVLLFLLRVNRATNSQVNGRAVRDIAMELQNMFVDRALQGKLDVGLRAELAQLRGLL